MSGARHPQAPKAEGVAAPCRRASHPPPHRHLAPSLKAEQGLASVGIFTCPPAVKWSYYYLRSNEGHQN